jgi:hypothetical protein
VLPTVPLLAVIVSMGLYLREETDEFERAVHTESALWASGGVLILATLLGFFELLAGGPRFPNWLWFPAWCVMIGLASLFIRRRYR